MAKLIRVGSQILNLDNIDHARMGETAEKRNKIGLHMAGSVTPGFDYQFDGAEGAALIRYLLAEAEDIMAEAPRAEGSPFRAPRSTPPRPSAPPPPGKPAAPRPPTDGQSHAAKAWRNAPQNAAEAKTRYYAAFAAIGTRWEDFQRYMGMKAPEPSTLDGWIMLSLTISDMIEADKAEQAAGHDELFGEIEEARS